jgi:hypothetical protein
MARLLLQNYSLFLFYPNNPTFFSVEQTISLPKNVIAEFHVQCDVILFPKKYPFCGIALSAYLFVTLQHRY